MILSNVEIHRALDEGRLILDPEPVPRIQIAGSDGPYGTHSVDLRLGDQLSIPTPGKFVVDLTQPGGVSEQILKNSQRETISNSRPFRLEQNQFILGITYERVGLPIDPARDTCLAARIEGKSSRTRFGLLIHFTAPTVHPGWDGHLVLEMINLGASPILLTPGMYIAQLIVEEVKGVPILSPSEFQQQSNPTGTK